MQTEINREMLKHHVGMALFCPACGTVLDCRRAVEVDMIGPNGAIVSSIIRCSTCYDNTVAGAVDKVKAAHPDVTIEIHDGRELFASHAKPKKAKKPARVIEVGKTYWIHHSSGYIKATVIGTHGHRDLNTRSGVTPPRRTHYDCRNESTGRMITVKSAAKFREEVAA
jgi:hypothetical protein